MIYVVEYVIYMVMFAGGGWGKGPFRNQGGRLLFFLLFFLSTKSEYLPLKIGQILATHSRL